MATVAWDAKGNPISNISSGWKLIWDNQSNSTTGGGIYPYRNNLVVGDFDGNGSDDVLGIGPSLWTTWFTYVPNASPTVASWQWQDSNYGTVNNASHPMSYMTPYNYQPIVGNFYQPNKDAVILSMPSGNWMASFQLVGGTWTWYQSNQGQTNNAGVGYEMSYLTPYIGNLKTGDFNGDGITDILGGSGGSTHAYIRPEWNPVNSNYKWAVKWLGSGYGIFTTYSNLVTGNYDSDYAEEIFAYNSSGNCAHVAFNATTYAPYLETPNMTMISDWNMSPLTASTNYVFLKTDENSSQEQLLCIRNPDAALYSFRPNIESATPCSTLRLANTQGESAKESHEDLKKDGVSIFPNPSNGNFLITLQNPIDQSSFSIRLFDVEGRELEDFKLNFTNNNSLDLKFNNAKTGVYFLRIINNKEVYSKKVVVF